MPCRAPDPRPAPVRIGIDTGGTFTDFVVFADGALRSHKVPSTPAAPHEAVARGLAELGIAPSPDIEVVHGTTVATNAVLERRGGRVALVTTAGFEDLIEIGRQDRAKLYDLDWTPLPPLVPRELRFGVRERMGPDGAVITPLAEEEVAAVARGIAGRVDAVVVGFLHSYANDVHERRAAEILAATGVPVRRSSEVLPEYREYERFATAAADAYVLPVVQRHLEGLTRALGAARLRLLTGSGGSTTAEGARARPVELLLSGPAAGVAAGVGLAKALGLPRVLTLDMGGTSADIALIDGEPRRTREGSVGGVPIRTPVLELETIGAGGGSIAWIDDGGALRVGPGSAGGDPGPACYGRGGRGLTLTDAHLLLGRIPTDLPIARGLRLDVGRAREAAEKLGIEEAARGAIDVANASITRAIRRVSVERGYDPADFHLVAFGGMGGLHACDLVEALGLRGAIIPRAPGCFSALGAVMAGVARERWCTVLRPLGELSDGELERAFDGLEQELCAGRAQPRMARFLEARYAGQSYEIAIPWEGGRAQAERAFHEAHRRRHEHADEETPIEVVNAGVRIEAEPEEPFEFAPMGAGGAPRSVAESQGMPVYRREEFGLGHTVRGPAVFAEATATTFVAPGFAAKTDRFGFLWLERAS